LMEDIVKGLGVGIRRAKGLGRHTTPFRPPQDSCRSKLSWKILRPLLSAIQA
jgi:hypothetical protein